MLAVTHTTPEQQTKHRNVPDRDNDAGAGANPTCQGAEAAVAHVSCDRLGAEPHSRVQHSRSCQTVSHVAQSADGRR